MRKTLLLLPLLAAACGAQDSLTNNGAPNSAAPAGGEPGSASLPGQPVQTATLIGLYEGPAGPQRNQMCMIDRPAGGTRFGLVVRGAGAEGCSGVGSAVRQGDVLRLTMSGDEPCTIEARIEGTRVAFPPSLPAGCAYYCSRGARFAGAAFDKTGGTAEDARRAQDLIGDPLCAR